AAVAGPAVAVGPSVVGGEQVVQCGEQVRVAPGARLDHGEARRGVGDPYVEQAVAGARGAQERGDLAGEVDDGLAAAGPDLDQLAVHGRSVPPVRKAFGEEFDVPDGYLNTASIGIPSVAVGEAVAGAIA